MPTIFRKYGYRFHFFANERNEPAHIHVTGKGGEMKVWLIGPLRVASVFKVSPADQRKIMEVIRENAKLFLEEWHEFSRKKN